MGRGMIYEVQTRKEDLFCISQESFDDFNEAEAFVDVDGNGRVTNLVAFASRFKNYGASVEKKADEFGNMYLTLQLTEEAKQNYFKDSFKAFMDMVKSLTIEQFVDEHIADKLKNSIECDCWDAVSMNGSSYIMPLDKFVREAEPGVVYYIGNLVYMR